PARGRPPWSADGARHRAHALRGIVHGRHDRPGVCARAPHDDREPRALRYDEPVSGDCRIPLGRPDPHGGGAGHGADGGADPRTLVHRALPDAARGSHGAGRGNDSADAAQRIRRMLPRDSEDQRDQPSRGAALSGARHRWRGGPGHARRYGARDPGSLAGCRARDPALGLASVQSGAAPGVQPGSGALSRQGGWARRTLGERVVSRHVDPPGPPRAAPVPEPSYAERARTLMARGRTGTLCTVSRRLPGHPFGSLMPYALDQSGQPIFLISTLAMHTRNLEADPRASLFVTESTASEDPLAAGRLTVMGEAGGGASGGGGGARGASVDS